MLGNRHAAEDAFQATFLVLARKATAIARREQLASWLHGVARRAAMDARARAARQHAKEKRLGIMSPVDRMDEIQKSELRSILDEELARLPERHRTAIVLCELEGLSRREAAGRLGCVRRNPLKPIGTSQEYACESASHNADWPFRPPR